MAYLCRGNQMKVARKSATAAARKWRMSITRMNLAGVRQRRIGGDGSAQTAKTLKPREKAGSGK
jgi:hypothetical protein